jgi:hypothetical protein
MSRAVSLRLVLFASLLFTADSSSAGEPFPRIVETANFLVNGPTSEIGELVGQRAEQFRREIALAWLGTEIPTSEHVNLIYVNIDPSRSIGRTIVSRKNRGHYVRLTGPLEDVSEYMVAHEVAHTVIAAKYGLEFPAWANEGIASVYDEPARCQIREGIERDFVANNSWPQIADVMAEPIRSQSQYTVAASLTQLLVTQNSRTQFIAFVEAGQGHGWDAALRDHYDISGVGELQLLWQRWVFNQVSNRERRSVAMSSQRSAY